MIGVLPLNLLQKTVHSFLTLIYLLMFAFCLSACSLRSSPSPTEVENFSSDFSEACTYEITGANLNVEVMNRYPQCIKEQSIDEDEGRRILLLVQNESYYDIDDILIDNQIYPDTVLPYLEPSEKISWNNEEMDVFLSKIQGNDVQAYVNNAVWWTNKTLAYDSDLAQEISIGKSDTVGAIDALASGKGTCSEYSNLLLAALRARGIPARFVSGVLFDEASPVGFTTFHSWVEVYFQGYGWIPADATVGRIGVQNNYIKLYVGKDFVDIGIPLKDIQVTSIKKPD